MAPGVFIVLDYRVGLNQTVNELFWTMNYAFFIFDLTFFQRHSDFGDNFSVIAGSYLSRCKSLRLPTLSPSILCIENHVRIFVFWNVISVSRYTIP
jgi:hypothetical protein